MKRWAKGFGIALVVVVAILVLLPFVSLNRYKPQFQEQLAKHLNGQIDFNDAHLTVLSGLGVEFENVSIANTTAQYSGQKVIQASRLKFRVAFWPLFRKQIRARVEFMAPHLDVQKGAEKNSLTTLFKKDEPVAQQVAPAENSTPSGSVPPPLKNPTMLDNAMVSAFDMTDARFTLTDTRAVPPKRVTSITNFSLSATDIGYNRDVDVRAKLLVDDPFIQGPVEATLKLRAENRENKFERLALSGNFDATKAVVRHGSWFLKNAEMPLKFDFAGTATTQQLQLPEFKLTLLDTSLTGLLSVSNYTQMQTRLELALPETELVKLKDVFIRHGDLLQDGKLSFKSDMEGSVYGSQPLNLRADLKISALKSDAHISVITLDARKKKFDLTMRSGAIVLDDWLVPVDNPVAQASPPAAIETSVPVPSQKSEGAAPTTESKSVINEPATAPIAEALPPATDSSFEVNFNAQTDLLTYKQMTSKDVMFIGIMTKDAWKIERLSMKSFGGSIQTSGTIVKSEASKPFDMRLALSRINPGDVSKAFGHGTELPFKGTIDVQSNFKGKAENLTLFLDSLEGQGTYVVSEGGVSNRSVALAVQKDLEKKVGQLPVAKGLGKLDSLLQNERVQDLAKKNNVEIDKLRKDIGDIRELKIADEQSVSGKLTGVHGKFVVKNRNVQFQTNNVHDSGKLFLDSSVAFDSRMQGKGRYEFSDSFKEKMLSQSRQVRHLFDTDGSLVVEFSLAGTINDPQVDIAFQKLVDRYERNAGKSVEEDAKKIIDDLMKGDSRKKIDSLKEKLKKQLEKNKIKIPGL